MNTFRNTLKIIKRGPMVTLLMCVVVFFITFLDYNNPVYTLIFGYGEINSGNIISNIIYLLQFLLKPELQFKVAVTLIGAILLLSLVSGLLLSVYLNAVNNSLNDTRRFKNEFIFAIKKYFFKLFYMSVIITLIFIAFIIVTLISVIPALSITSVVTMGRNDIIIPMIFINLLTVYAVFFAFMFIRAYSFYWFPASINYNINPFKIAKRVVNDNFWEIVGKFIVFDIIFALFNTVLLSLRLINEWPLSTQNGVILFVINGIFNSVFALNFVTWIFASFKKFKQREIIRLKRRQVLRYSKSKYR